MMLSARLKKAVSTAEDIGQMRILPVKERCSLGHV